MTPLQQTGVTELLVNWSNGDQEALNKLIPLVYDELHKLARRYLRRERPDHILTRKSQPKVAKVILKLCWLISCEQAGKFVDSLAMYNSMTPERGNR